MDLGQWGWGDELKSWIEVVELMQWYMQTSPCQGEEMPGPHLELQLVKGKELGAEQGEPRLGPVGTVAPILHPTWVPWVPPVTGPGPSQSVNPHPASMCSTLVPQVPPQHPLVAPAVSPGFPSHPPAPELMTHPQHGHLFVLVADRLMFLMAHNHFSEVI